MKTRMLNGYVVIHVPGHPSAMTSENWDGYVYEHIYVVEKVLGRELLPNEVVHHLNLNRSDNRPENLLVLDRGQHTKLHKWLSSGAPMSKDVGTNGVNSGKPTLRRCPVCGNPVLKPRLTYCSLPCARIASRKVQRPSLKTLLEDVKTMSMVAVGKKYGVTDNAVRKWLRTYGVTWQS